MAQSELPTTPIAVPSDDGAVAPLPLRSGTRAECAALRSFLADIGFTPEGILERTGSPSIEELTTKADIRPVALAGDALDVMISMLLQGEAAHHDLLARHVPDGMREVLQTLGLLEDIDTDPAACRAPLALYPAAGLYIVSDHTRTFAAGPPADVVYPALASNTTDFLSSLPTTPCDALLDVGAGTGIAALVAASTYARQAWALDITGRATRIAQFNAQLNGIDNVTVLEGDLYAPVAGLTFDRIVSHPPYMPSTETRLIFRDAGEDGEQITRRLLAGLPEYLRPGGRFCCRFMATDRKGAPLENRLRRMLGEAEPEFDVVLATTVVIPVTHFFCRLLANGDINAAEVEQRLQVFQRLGVENVVIGFAAIERRVAPTARLTLRKELAPKVVLRGDVVDRLLEWERAPGDPQFTTKLLAGTPRLASGAEVQLTQRVREGELRADVCTVNAKSPFVFTLQSSAGIALLLARCDGSRSVAELYDEMKQLGVIPAHAPPEEFLDLIRVLTGGGVLELDGFALGS